VAALHELLETLDADAPGRAHRSSDPTVRA